MIELEVELRNFGPLPNGQRVERISQVELIKSAITVGYSGWSTKWTHGTRSVFDILRRVFTIKAALVSRDGRLFSTALYRQADSSEMSMISAFIGNTICSVLAQRIARIPWLLSLSVYKQSLRPTLAIATRSCPDFVGQTPAGDWYVFEAKGRTRPFLATTLRKAKEQSGLIATVKQQPVTCGLASVAYLGTDDQLRAIWDDPPPSPAKPDNTELELSEDQYFDNYYEPIFALLQAVAADSRTERGTLGYLPSVDVYVGLHEEVRFELRARRFNRVRKFAAGRLQSNPGAIERSRGEFEFPDGMIVRGGATWSGIFEPDQPRVRDR